MKTALGPVFRTLDPEGAAPLYRQLYDVLREALIAGVVPPGSRLPSTRTLADDLKVSRNTVSAAFDCLVDDGFIESRVGAGSFVSPALTERVQLERPATGMPVSDALSGASPRTPAGPEVSATDGDADEASAGPQRTLSRRGADIARMRQGRDPDQPRAFSVGVPALDAFPLATWRRLVSRRARQATPDDLRHGDVAGDPRLRQLIARHLTTARGVRCTAEQIVMLPSAQLGLDIASRMLLDPGDAAWMEEPGYLGARGALQAAGARLVPVPVDAEGLDVEAGRSLDAGARLAYVTPSHQFPLGVSMSLRRRLQLLTWANETGAWIIEDDYDSEYRYAGPATQALQGLDQAGRVFYLGTFSKVLFPALRLAYMVVPRDLRDAFIAARFLVDGHVPLAIQKALADFIDAGHLVGHLRRMRRLYHQRRDVLLAEGARRFAGRLHFSGAEAGMHVTARLHAGKDHHLARAAAKRGLDIAPLSRYYIGPHPSQGVPFGYAHVPEEEIVRACKVLAAILR